MTELTVDRLRALLDYDAVSGVFTWKARCGCTPLTQAWNAKNADKVAGAKWKRPQSKTPYIAITVDCRLYAAHRLAWLYHYGSWPMSILDHEDTDGTNNAISNLREATHWQNVANCSVRAHNTSGFKGVHWDNRTGKWRAEIKAGGKRYRLGRFETPEAAGAAYADAAKTHHGKFARIA